MNINDTNITNDDSNINKGLPRSLLVRSFKSVIVKRLQIALIAPSTCVTLLVHSLETSK